MIRRIAMMFPQAQSTSRVAASVALGAGLGMLYAGSPAWIVWVVLVLALRTHLPSVLIGWLAGWLLGFVMAFVYVPIGRHILLGFEPFWRAVLVQPVICCCNLNQARMMGSVVAALAAMAIAAAIVLAARYRRR